VRVVLETPQGTHLIDCREGEFIWDAAARSGVTLPAICHQGRCLTCASRLIEGEVDQSKADAYYPEDRAAAFVLVCTAVPLTAVVLRTHQEREMRRHRIALGLPAPYA
jgi:ferredoxin